MLFWSFSVFANTVWYILVLQQGALFFAAICWLFLIIHILDYEGHYQYEILYQFKLGNIINETY